MHDRPPTRDAHALVETKRQVDLLGLKLDALETAVTDDDDGDDDGGAKRQTDAVLPQEHALVIGRREAPTRRGRAARGSHP